MVLSFKKELLFEKRSKNFCYLALLAFVFIVHAPALGAFFAADDFLWLAHGQWADAGRAFTGSWGLGTAYRPLARLSFVVDARAFGMHAWAWHLENLVWQVIAAALLAAVTREAGMRRRDAVAAALLFAALPVAWENVDWISGRTGLLMVVFGLLCVLCWLKWLRGPAFWLVCAGLAQAAALLCYEPAAVIPLALLVASPALAARGVPWRRMMAGVGALAGGVAGLWLVRAVMLGTPFLGVDVASAHVLPGMARNMAGILLHAWSDLGPVAFCIAAVLIVAGLARSGTRYAVAGLLAAAFVLYVPFWFVDGVTERFFYASGAALVLALVVAATSWRGLRPVLAVVVVLFAWRSHTQAEGVRAAGQWNRAMLAQIAALPADGSALVFDAVPTHLGPYYLLWGAFEIAVALVRPGYAIAARSENVLADGAALRSVLAGPTRFMTYDAGTRRMVNITRAAWLARHPAAVTP